MAKLKLQVVVLALSLAGVLVAKHYISKIVEQSPAADVTAASEVRAPTP